MQRYVAIPVFEEMLPLGAEGSTGCWLHSILSCILGSVVLASDRPSIVPRGTSWVPARARVLAPASGRGWGWVAFH